MRPVTCTALTAMVATVTLLGCGETEVGNPEFVVPGGDPEVGAELIDAYGCGACHTVGGIDGADGTVGPPLSDFGSRRLIAGLLPNTPLNLVAWIVDPQEVEPGTAMPDLGVEPDEATDIAAYLYDIAG